MKADVYLYGKHAGILEKHSNGYEFNYRADYFGPPLSLSLPVNQTRFASNLLFPFFKSLLPEGWLLTQYSRAQKIDERDEFNLLVNNGEDLLGAVTVKPVQESE